MQEEGFFFKAVPAYDMPRFKTRENEFVWQPQAVIAGVKDIRGLGGRPKCLLVC